MPGNFVTIEDEAGRTTLYCTEVGIALRLRGNDVEVIPARGMQLPDLMQFDEMAALLVPVKMLLDFLDCHLEISLPMKGYTGKSRPQSIWCGLNEEGRVQATHLYREGIESLTTECTTNGGSYREPCNLLPVLYEPAVPRCKTCPLFRDDLPFDLPCCPRLTMVPRDGSGYCSEHPEARP